MSVCIREWLILSFTVQVKKMSGTHYAEHPYTALEWVHQKEACPESRDTHEFDELLRETETSHGGMSLWNHRIPRAPLFIFHWPHTHKDNSPTLNPWLHYWTHLHYICRSSITHRFPGIPWLAWLAWQPILTRKSARTNDPHKAHVALLPFKALEAHVTCGSFLKGPSKKTKQEKI